MKKVTFLNHASVLIQNNEDFILTDPWYKKPAFGSWLSTPPCIYHPAYLAALSYSSKKFVILISHGHDDHLDDNMLTLMSKETTILIPKYKSIGLKKRIEKIGFKNIVEFDNKGINFNDIIYKSYVFEDVSMDDALITIEANEFIIAHANDNWQPLQEEVLNNIRSDFDKYKNKSSLFMSQTNMADGFPLIYENYSKAKKLKLVKTRQERIITEGIRNAKLVNASSFLSYAGMAIPFIKNKSSLKDDAYHKSIKEIKAIADFKKLDSNIVLNMSPGDSYDFENVIKLFGNQENWHKNIKNASIDFFEKYKWLNDCDSFMQYKNIDRQEKLIRLNTFLSEFKKFVINKNYQLGGYQSSVFKFEITFKDSEVSHVIDFNNSDKIHVSFNFEPEILSALLTGKINWESTYIGYNSKITVECDYNIGSLIRWLSMFGYVYQKRICKE